MFGQRYRFLLQHLYLAMKQLKEISANQEKLLDTILDLQRQIDALSPKKEKARGRVVPIK